MNYEFKIVNYYYNGDHSEEEGKNFLMLLKDGWEIISTGGGVNKIVYILKKREQHGR